MNSIPFGNLDMLRQAPTLTDLMNKVTMEGPREGMEKKRAEWLGGGSRQG